MSAHPEEGPESGGTPVAGPPWPNPRYAWYVVIILFVASIFSFLDRQILSLLVEEIKRDLELSEFQVGLLSGAPFAIFYAFMSIPIALAADTLNRRNIIAIGITVWSFATAACGIAMGFWQMFLARVMVGSGEAALSPSAYSLISDYFPKEKLARAMATFTMGNLTGVGFAAIIGGTVATYVETLGRISLPFVGELFGWQITFFVVGLPGLLLALVVLTIKEPVRRGLMNPERSVAGEDQLRQFGHFVLAHWKAFAGLFASFTLLVLIAYGNFSWVVTFYRRSFGWDKELAGLVYGVVVLFFGTGGAFFGGWFSDWLRGRGYTDAPYRATLICTIPLAPFAILSFVVAPSLPLGADAQGYLSAAMLAPWQFFGSVPAGLGAAAMMTITPNEMRAKISSVYLFFSNLIGITAGAASVAAITQYVFRDDMMVRYSLAIVNCVGAPLAVLLIWLSMKHYRASLRQVEAAA